MTNSWLLFMGVFYPQLTVVQDVLNEYQQLTVVSGCFFILS
jgi:hypothetical protein